MAFLQEYSLTSSADQRDYTKLGRVAPVLELTELYATVDEMACGTDGKYDNF